MRSFASHDPAAGSSFVWSIRVRPSPDGHAIAWKPSSAGSKRRFSTFLLSEFSSTPTAGLGPSRAGR